MTTNAVICNFDGDDAQICEQGATFEFPFTWEDNSGTLVDLSGYTNKMQVKDNKDNVIVELTTANGRIYLDSNGTQLTLFISATDTAGLPAGKYSYDLFLTPSSGNTVRLLKGVFEVEARVTT